MMTVKVSSALLSVSNLLVVLSAGEVGDGFEHFQSLDCFMKTPFMLGCGRRNLVLCLTFLLSVTF